MVGTLNENGTKFTGLFGTILERIRTNANIDLACGESRTVGDTTIIPIGVVSYGFGFGMGSQPSASADGQAAEEGGGGGGGAWIQPIAIVTITNGKTKVIPILDLARTIPALIGAVGKMALGMSRRAQGRSVFGPGTMTVAPKRGKHAAHEADGVQESQEKE
jgi:uncharacterized spore protein YtfJ